MQAVDATGLRARRRRVCQRQDYVSYDRCFMNNAVVVTCFQYISFEVCLKISEI